MQPLKLATFKICGSLEMPHAHASKDCPSGSMQFGGTFSCCIVLLWFCQFHWPFASNFPLEFLNVFDLHIW